MNVSFSQAPGFLGERVAVDEKHRRRVVDANAVGQADDVGEAFVGGDHLDDPIAGQVGDRHLEPRPAAPGERRDE